MRARRLVALLLILVFAPATMLAAMPLSFCLGSDGHQAIEYVVQDDHGRAEVGLDPLITSGAEQLADVIGAVEHPECVDVALLSDARTAKPGNNIDGARLADLLPPCLLPRNFDAQAFAQREPNPFALASIEHGTSPQLVALRTVILRI